MKWLLVVAIAWIVALPAAQSDDAVGVAAIAVLAQEIAARTDPRVADVLPKIDGVGRRLLALRSYLRSNESLGERWSWTEAQIAAYEGSAERVALNAEIERVRAAFEHANPGYQLFVNPRVRSLDVQLASWNNNESVAAAADRLLHDVLTGDFDAGIAVASRGAALEAFLRSYVPDPVPAVAAPGLSPHGQMRAVDFQVHRGAEIVAGPDTKTIGPVWDEGAWAARLDTAVRSASRKFIGPLILPREPWHYTYSPVAVADQ